MSGLPTCSSPPRPVRRVRLDEPQARDSDVSRSASGSSVGSAENLTRVALRRQRTISGSKAEDHLMMTDKGKCVFTKGRPPWYDIQGKKLKEPFVIGICGGSASGKTTVAEKIISSLEMPWVTVLSLDSFYKVLTEEQHAKATSNEYNFDHPDAFDFDLLYEILSRLRDGKCSEVPVYNFSTHAREKHQKVMYGADVIIFEGILAFHRQEIRDMMNLKIFVDTDSDTRLARRLERDIVQRGRDVEGVLMQYFQTVKPSFDNFISPAMKLADIIVPRGGENVVAIDLITKQVKGQLAERGYDAQSYTRAELAQSHANGNKACPAPESLRLLTQSPQVKGMHTFIRNRETSRDELIFYSKRLMRLLIEFSLSLLPFESVTLETTKPKGVYNGKRSLCKDRICAISILRAGETMEGALREVVKDAKMGKILIQTNPTSLEPELYYLRLPKEIFQYRVLLLDATVATGAAAMMAIRVLLDHDVPEENIQLLSLLMAETGVSAVAYAFPKVTLVTTAVDRELSVHYHILPGMGNYGDRYYGTDRSTEYSESSSDEEFMPEAD